MLRFGRAWSVAACLGLVWLAIVGRGVCEITRFEYDTLERLVRVLQDDGTTIDYVYDNLGNRLMKTTTLSGAPTNLPPSAVSNPGIPNGATNVPIASTLSWSPATDPNPGDVVVYFVYFGTSPTPPLMFSGWPTNCSPGNLRGLTTFYWRVAARDSHNAETLGPLWSFTTANEPPVANFVASPTNGWSPLTVAFSDRSTSSDDALVAWAWDFNNDGTVDSTNRNPSFTYTNAGDFSVRLTVTDEHGATNSAVKSNFISILGNDILDLAVLNLSVELAGSYRHLTVRYSVTNLGTVPVSARWQWADQFYLSTNATFDASATYLGAFYENQSLLPGTVYTRTNVVTIPAVAAGNYYLLLKTDANSQIGEISETNNVGAVPLAGRLPDLTGTGISFTGQAVAGRTLSLTWVFTNQGAIGIDGDWYDAFYLSTNSVWDTNATRLGNLHVTQAVPPQGSYTRTNSVTLAKWPPGDYFLLVKADDNDNLVESNEVNNARSLPVNLGAPDLAPVSVTPLAAAVSGKSAQIAYTVTNQGNAPAFSSWTDRLYLSTNAVWDTNDLLLTSTTQSQSVTNGNIYSKTNLATLPAWAGGSYFLILRADFYDGVYESSEANNDLVVPVTLTVPDLSPVAGSVSPVVSGRTLSVVTVVTNRGDGAALASWSDGWYWSTNATWETNDTYLTAFSQSVSVAAGSSYTRTNTLTVPASAEGTNFLIVRADYNNGLFESDENNNVLALAVANVPDLIPVAIEMTNAAVAGKALSVITTVTNLGTGVAAGSWADYLYLSTDAVWGTNDLQLTTYTQSTAVTNGQAYRRTNSVTLPNWAGGPYYLILRADRNNALYELSDGNNDRFVPVTLTVPDLSPLAGSVSPVVSGRTLSVVTVVTNRGDGAALATWSDGWYWSTNATWETNDTYLTSFNQSTGVTAGGSYTRTNTLTVPASAEGTNFLIVRADYNNGLFESDENNNTLALAVAAVPDLVPLALETTNAAVSGKPFGLVSVVTNAGTGVAAGSWTDYLYLSTDAVWGTNDLQLTTYTQSTAVTNGQAYRRTNSVTLPNWAGGPYYLILRADRNNALYELSDGNNDLIVPVTLTVPDLSPVAGSVSPVVTGRTLSVVTVVTNRGDGAALASWSDGWYWSVNATWETNDTYLTSFSQSTAVAAGGSYTRTNTLTVPTTAEGTNYLIVRADYNAGLFESDEGNNALTLAVTNVPDLMPVALEMTNAAVSGKAFSVVSVVTNAGTGVAGGSWADYLYLSTDAVWGTNDLQLTTYTQSAAVTNGQAYRRTNSVTLPNWAGGPYYLILRADRNNALYELSDGNNDLIVPVTLTVPDLSPLAGSVSPVVSGRTLSVVTVVTNRGDGAALASWSDGWYWSTNATWETNDTYLTSFSQSASVAASGSYTRTNTLTVPATAAGTSYLIVRADYNAGLFESDEGNNTLALAVTNVPDLMPVALDLTNAAVSGKNLGVVTTVTNAGTGVASGSWADYLYLSTDAVWGTNDLQLTTYTQSAAVTNGQAYRRTNNVTLPNWAGGQYYLILRADRNNALYELADTNNDLIVPVTLTVPGLVAANLSWGGGDPIPGWPLTVIWTVLNTGDGAASASWSDAVYFSSNSVLDGTDTLLRTQSRSQSLAVGGSYQVTNTVTIPANAPPGYYLILKADDQNAVFEVNEANNWRAFGVSSYRDTDGDGLPDFWEQQYFGSTTNCVPGADSDGDGLPNVLEFLADTIPTNALSVLRLTGLVPEANGLRIEWQGGVAARQFLERSKSLGAAGTNWVTIFTNNPPTPLQTNLFELLGTNRTFFYRVRAVRE